MRHIALILVSALALAGCALQKVATATVPAAVVVPAANTFDILKAGATNYGQYCINKKMVPAICSADTRRIVIKAVRAGTGARKQMEDSLTTGQPALASVYNVLVGAIDSLQTSPAASAQFTGSTQ